MKIEEMVIIKITPPSIRKRKEMDYWDMKRHPDLSRGIEKCIVTGQEVFILSDDHTQVFVIKPEYPLIPSAMAEKRNKSLMKLSIAVYHAAFHLGVRQ